MASDFNLILKKYKKHLYNFGYHCSLFFIQQMEYITLVENVLKKSVKYESRYCLFIFYFHHNYMYVIYCNIKWYETLFIRYVLFSNFLLYLILTFINLIKLTIEHLLLLLNLPWTICLNIFNSKAHCFLLHYIFIIRLLTSWGLNYYDQNDF